VHPGRWWRPWRTDDVAAVWACATQRLVATLVHERWRRGRVCLWGAGGDP